MFYKWAITLVSPQDHPGSRERKAALTLRWKRGEAGADFCQLGAWRTTLRLLAI